MIKDDIEQIKGEEIVTDEVALLKGIFEELKKLNAK